MYRQLSIQLLRTFGMILMVISFLLSLFGCKKTVTPTTMAPKHSPVWTAEADELRTLIDKHGLTKYSDDLVTLAQPSARFRTAKADEAKLAVGASKLGGRPDLPAGFTWPTYKNTPMGFIAQLNLADIPAIDADLPRSGMLYFFYETKEMPWGFEDKDKGSCRVVYVNGGPSTLSQTAPPANLPEESVFAACALTAHKELVLPGWEAPEVDRLQLSDGDSDAYLELTDDSTLAQGGDDTITRLLGYAHSIQGDVLEECPAGRQWRLLLQVDSEDDANMMWGDAGRIYFCIMDDDLHKQDFSNVFLILQCY